MSLSAELGSNESAEFSHPFLPWAVTQWRWRRSRKTQFQGKKMLQTDRNPGPLASDRGRQEEGGVRRQKARTKAGRTTGRHWELHGARTLGRKTHAPRITGNFETPWEELCFYFFNLSSLTLLRRFTKSSLEFMGLEVINKRVTVSSWNKGRRIDFWL